MTRLVLVNGISKYVTETLEEIQNESVGEQTCDEGETSADIKFDVVSCVYSFTCTKVDRRRTRKIRQKLSGGVEIDEQISKNLTIQYIEKKTEK